MKKLKNYIILLLGISIFPNYLNAQDLNNPIAVCKNIDVYINFNGDDIILTPEQIDDGSYDQEGNVSLSIDNDTLRCEDIGENTLTLTVTDENNNVSTCESIVTVIDNIPPVSNCPFGEAITLNPDSPEDITYPLDDYSEVALDFFSDNCTNPVIFVSQSPEAGTLLTTGDYVISITVKDSSGNFSSCSQFLTVEILPLSIKEFLKSNPIKISPNPSADIINIKLPANHIRIDEIEIIDINGKLIKRLMNIKNQSHISLNLKELEEGFYFIKIQIGDIFIKKKIIKKQ